MNFIWINNEDKAQEYYIACKDIVCFAKHRSTIKNTPNAKFEDILLSAVLRVMLVKGMEIAIEAIDDPIVVMACAAIRQVIRDNTSDKSITLRLTLIDQHLTYQLE